MIFHCYHVSFSQLASPVTAVKSNGSRRLYVSLNASKFSEKQKNTLHKLEEKERLWRESRCTIYKVIYDASTKTKSKLTLTHRQESRSRFCLS